MATEKMELVNINGRLDRLDDAISALLESGSFHIEEGFTHGASSGYKPLNEKNPYAPLLKRFLTLCTGLECEAGGGDKSKCRLTSPEEFEQLYDKIFTHYSELERKKSELDKDIALRSEASLQTAHLKGMNEDLTRLFELEYISIRFGKLPSDNAKKLEYFDRNFFFFPFDEDMNYTYGMYVCPKNEKEEIDEIFRTLFFERTRIPDFVKGSASKAYSDLQSEIEQDKKDLELTHGQIKEISERYREELKNACERLRYLKGAYSLRRKAGVLKDKFLIKGFIPAKDKDKLAEAFKGVEGAELTFLPPDSDGGCKPPTILKNGLLTRPFKMLVGMYGLPTYGGFDPTAFVAITYSLLFGIMFGDLGQGLLIVLLSIPVGKKLSRDMGGMMLRCGLCSMVFGTLYGSVFGVEDMLDPVYENIGVDFLPLRAFESTNFILFTAVGIGIFLIAVSMLINIVTSFKRRDIESAVFGCNGICGLVFYGSIVFAVVATMMLDMEVMSGAFVLFLIVIPAVCIFCRVPFTILVKYRKWKLSDTDEKMTVGGFIVENFFEMFEFVLSYISNTMSFLRVGGFVMSHAGMMLVVMTLMDGMSKIGQPIIFVIGNLFVMAMEGMIVAIQIIRLEFYEIFSRFYVSGGKEYVPITAELLKEDI